MTKTQLIHNLNTVCEKADRWDAIRAAAYQSRPVPARPRVWQWAAVAVVALVVAVLGVNQILHAPETAPPLLPEEPTAVVGATTDTTTETTGTSTAPSTTEPTAPTTTVPTNFTTTIKTRPDFSTTTAPTTTAPTISTTENNITTGRPTGPDTTVPSSTVHIGPITTIPVTQGTAPNGLPLLNSDGEVTTDRSGGFNGHVYAFSFEEMQVKSITSAPAVLPVYGVTDKIFETASPESVLRNYASLVRDTLLQVEISSYNNGVLSAQGERFRYNLNKGETNYIMLWLNDPLPLGAPDTWLSAAMTYCPALFADMQKPTLHLSGGGRWWNKESTVDPATAQDTVTFKAQIYDAAQDPDGVAKWLNGVSLQVEDGKLAAFFIMFEENYQKIGDYPVLTVEEATALAHQQCATWKEYEYYEVINENYEILSTELVYFTHSGSGLRVPIYRFLVTADETNYTHQLRAETGLTIFFEILVTAVPPEYWTENSRDMFITQK